MTDEKQKKNLLVEENILELTGNCQRLVKEGQCIKIGKLARASPRVRSIFFKM
jgi:hypothetical protein